MANPLHVAHQFLRHLLISLLLVAPMAVAQTLSNTTSGGLPRTAPVVAPDLTRTIELIELRRFDEAREKITNALSSKPRDAQWRFLEAVLLSETNQDREAIDAFEALTEEFPELAEPYNNLAVLYLRCNEPLRAQQALERAILNRPGYALAYENLGDLHAKLALDAYQKGLKARGPSPFLSAKRRHLLELPSPAPLGLQTRPPAGARPSSPAN
jgi:tetratricopeptide (TPR) repeat protein